MEEKKRTVIMCSMSDEDLLAAGIDPTTISEEMFDRIGEIATDRLFEQIEYLRLIAESAEEAEEERKENAQ